MSPPVRLGLIWILLLGGMAFVLSRIPMPGVREPILAPPEGLAGMRFESVPQGSAEEQYALGLTAAQEPGRTEEALAFLDRAIALDPAFAPAYVQKALTLARRDDADPAEIRRLLAEGIRRGFDRNRALAGAEHLQGFNGNAPEQIRSMLLNRSVLLGFAPPMNNIGARQALESAIATGGSPPRWLVQALDLPAQVPPPPGR